MEILRSTWFFIFGHIFIVAVLIVIPLLIIKKSKKRQIGLAIYALLVIWLARFLVILFSKDGIATGDGLPTNGLLWWEKLFDSLIHALQSFSMDEDYTQYTVAGKQLLEEAGLPEWSLFYGILVSIYNILAPVLGGALVLNILTSLFPSIKISLFLHRHKVVFSELNEASICLAEDIMRDKQYYKVLKMHTRFSFRPLIIFTDAYVDSQSEISSELFDRAKEIGAVCVKNDLINLRLSRSMAVTYLLMDEKVADNITSFSHLMRKNEVSNGKTSAWNPFRKKTLWPVADARLKHVILEVTVVPKDGITADTLRDAALLPKFKSGKDFEGRKLPELKEGGLSGCISLQSVYQKADGCIVLRMQLNLSGHPWNKAALPELDKTFSVRLHNGSDEIQLDVKHYRFSDAAVKQLTIEATLQKADDEKDEDWLKKLNRLNDGKLGLTLRAKYKKGNAISRIPGEEINRYIIGSSAVLNHKGEIKVSVSLDFSERPLDAAKDIILERLWYVPRNETNQEQLVPASYSIKTDVEYEPFTSIYIFVQELYESDLIRKIYAGSSYASNVVLRVIRDYMHATINLMEDVPLFMPLLYQSPAQDKETPQQKKEQQNKLQEQDNQNEKQDLYITILGSGMIASEVFKAVYWCGQMTNVRLHVNVLSRDAALFKAEIMEYCPELIECCKRRSPLLLYNQDGNHYNPPYIEELHFETISNVKLLSTYPDRILRNTHYYVIALGSDEENALMTTILSTRLARMRLMEECPETGVIVPSIFNSSLAEAMRVSTPDPKKHESYIMPFATFKERFSCENVFMVRFAKSAASTGQLYNRAQQMSLQRDEYTWWADIAKTIHVPYKLFGFGYLNKPSEVQQKEGRKYNIDPEKNFSDIDDAASIWIEHRRWNAFLRSQGFSCPTKKELETYYEDIEKHKNIPLKLHPCLVESSPGAPKRLPDQDGYDHSEYDRLDDVSMKVQYIKQKHANKTAFFGDALRENEYKQWDKKECDDWLKEIFHQRDLELKKAAEAPADPGTTDKP